MICFTFLARVVYDVSRSREKRSQMKYLIITDVHGNIEAMDAVLEDAKEVEGFDKILCLGDLIGYGPNPNECINRLREYDFAMVIGNHEHAVSGFIDVDKYFNDHAAKAVKWTRKQLTQDNFVFIYSLPETHTENDIMIVHGSPRYAIDEYLRAPFAAMRNASVMSTKICFIGHTHIPVVFSISDSFVKRATKHDVVGEKTFVLDSTAKFIINPGSVGQPRDRNPLAAYGIYDTETKLYKQYRTCYDIKKTSDKIFNTGVSTWLATRLYSGQ